MFFDTRFEDLSDLAQLQYGIGPLCDGGRHHFVVSLPGREGQFRQLCQLKEPAEIQAALAGFSWYPSEGKAARVFQGHKKACNKCLRVMESILYEELV
ncbi:MAG: hypothetical protein MI747_12435 [Desulfobacterales bacterium]|nr:hypothetical protein [Desulfobacterales bacterium]